MHISKTVSTQLAPHFKMSELKMPPSMDEVDHMSKVLYESAVGGIMYSLVCTSPNIDKFLSVVSR